MVYLQQTQNAQTVRVPRSAKAKKDKYNHQRIMTRLPQCISEAAASALTAVFHVKHFNLREMRSQDHEGEPPCLSTYMPPRQTRGFLEQKQQEQPMIRPTLLAQVPGIRVPARGGS